MMLITDIMQELLGEGSSQGSVGKKVKWRIIQRQGVDIVVNEQEDGIVQRH